MVDPADRPVAFVARGVTEPGVEDEVVPSGSAVLGATQHAFADEAGPLQRPSLGDVGHVGVGLDPVGGSGCEQVLGQHALGPGAVAEAPMLREDRDADLPGQAAGVRPVGDPEPADRAHRGAVAEGDDQPADAGRGVGDGPVVVSAEPVELSGDAGLPQVGEEGIVGGLRRPQPKPVPRCGWQCRHGSIIHRRRRGERCAS